MSWILISYPVETGTIQLNKLFFLSSGIITIKVNRRYLEYSLSVCNFNLWLIRHCLIHAVDFNQIVRGANWLGVIITCLVFIYKFLQCITVCFIIKLFRRKLWNEYNKSVAMHKSIHTWWYSSLEARICRSESEYWITIWNRSWTQMEV